MLQFFYCFLTVRGQDQVKFAIAPGSLPIRSSSLPVTQSLVRYKSAGTPRPASLRSTVRARSGRVAWRRSNTVGLLRRKLPREVLKLLDQIERMKSTFRGSWGEK